MINIISASTLFILIYSITPIFITLVGDLQWINETLMLALVLSSASFTAAIYSLVKEKVSFLKLRKILRSHYKTIILLGFFGILAASYFIVILLAGPATADWLEQGLFPVFMALSAHFFLKNHHPIDKRLLALLSA